MIAMNELFRQPTGASPSGAAADDKQILLDCLDELSGADRRSLLDFAQYLRARAGQEAAAITAAETPALDEPVPIPRPSEESVVKAIQRLTKTYPMLEKNKLLNETSSYMAQHMLQGRPAAEVIDELEALFAAHYQRLRDGEAAQ